MKELITSLPQEEVEEIDEIAQRWGSSRAGVLRAMLRYCLEDETFEVWMMDNEGKPVVSDRADEGHCFICNNGYGFGGHNGRPCPSGITQIEAIEERLRRGIRPIQTACGGLGCLFCTPGRCEINGVAL